MLSFVVFCPNNLISKFLNSLRCFPLSDFVTYPLLHHHPHLLIKPFLCHSPTSQSFLFFFFSCSPLVSSLIILAMLSLYLSHAHSLSFSLSLFFIPHDSPWPVIVVSSSNCLSLSLFLKCWINFSRNYSGNSADIVCLSPTDKQTPWFVYLHL